MIMAVLVMAAMMVTIFANMLMGWKVMMIGVTWWKRTDKQTNQAQQANTQTINHPSKQTRKERTTSEHA